MGAGAGRGGGNMHPRRRGNKAGGVIARGSSGCGLLVQAEVAVVGAEPAVAKRRDRGAADGEFGTQVGVQVLRSDAGILAEVCAGGVDACRGCIRGSDREGGPDHDGEEPAQTRGAEGGDEARAPRPSVGLRG